MGYKIHLGVLELERMGAMVQRAMVVQLVYQGRIASVIAVGNSIAYKKNSHDAAGGASGKS